MSLKTLCITFFAATMLIFGVNACGGSGSGGGSAVPPVSGAAPDAPILPPNSGGQPDPSSPAPGLPTMAPVTPTTAPGVATAPPTTSSQILSHIPTWAYDEYSSFGTNASSSAVQRYVTYAEGGIGNAKALNDCGGSPKSCYSVSYLDPNLIYASCPGAAQLPFLSAAQESWFLHESGFSDFAHRLRGSYTRSCGGGAVSVPVYIADQANPAVQAFYRSYLQNNGDAWDYIFMDDTSGRIATQTYGPGGGFCGGPCSSTQEYPTDAAVVQAHGAFASAMTHRNGTPMKFIFNGIGFSGSTINNLDVLQSSDHFAGAMCEGCIVSANTLRPQLYQNVLNAMAKVNAIPGAKFVELNTGNAPAGSTSQIAQRLATTAVAWLGYSDGHTVVFPDLEYNTQNLAVWPEDQIYPSQAVESMASSANDIAVAPGVWRREFAACYNGGTAIGPCAALLNGTGSAVTVQSAWLHQAYRHVIALSGGDILSGGSVQLSSTSFVPNSTTIAPSAAILLAR